MTALHRRQRELKEGDRVFAARLGMSRQMWFMLRTGRTPPGRRTLEAILRAFPEYQLQVMALLFVAPDSKTVESSTTLEVAG